MTKQEATGLLAASSHDPVLAAWAAVCFEYQVPARGDFSPYDAWDAYQELFNLGAISPTVFDNTDVKQEFFSGRRPSEGAVQHVLDTYSNPDPEEGAVTMSLRPGSPFGNKNALAPRETKQISSRTPAIPLGGQQMGSSPGLMRSSLAPQQSLAPQSSPAPTLGSPMASRTALGAPTSPQPDLSRNDIDSLTPVMHCSCGEKLALVNEGGQIEEDDFPNGNVRVIDAMFAADCPNPECGLVWHCSVGRAIPNGAFR